jgi:hypothetical protein
VEELQKKLDEMSDTSLEKQIGDIKNKFAKQRKEIEETIARKRAAKK